MENSKLPADSEPDRRTVIEEHYGLESYGRGFPEPSPSNELSSAHAATASAAAEQSGDGGGLRPLSVPAPCFSFEVKPGPGGSWNLHLFENGEPAGGGQFPEEDYCEALEEGKRWIESRRGPVAEGGCTCGGVDIPGTGVAHLLGCPAAFPPGGRADEQDLLSEEERGVLKGFEAGLSVFAPTPADILELKKAQEAEEAREKREALLIQLAFAAKDLAEESAGARNAKRVVAILDLLMAGDAGVADRLSKVSPDDFSEPWRAEDEMVFDSRDWTIFDGSLDIDPGEQQQRYARRIAACANFCAGVKTEYLEERVQRGTPLAGFVAREGGAR